MGNEIKVTLYKNINNVDVDIKDHTPLFEKIKKSIKHIGNTNYSIIINKKKEGFFSFFLNKLKLILNIKTSIKNCRNQVNDCFYTQLNADTSLCKIRDINDITLDKFSVMNLLFKLDGYNDNKNEVMNLFVKRNVKTKADLILMDKLFNSYESKKFGEVTLRDFVDEKFEVGEVVNLFNTIILDVNNNINNNIFLFILNSYLKKEGSKCISGLIDSIFKSIKNNKYLFEIDKSILNNKMMTKVFKNINIGKFVSEMEINLEIEKELIDQIIDEAFQKYNNADNYAKTQEAWINSLYNKKENSKILYYINKNRVLITQRIGKIVNSLDDDEMIIGMPKEQYIIRMEQILDIFSAIQAR